MKTKTQKVTLSGDETGTMTYKQAVRLLEKNGYRQDRGTYPSSQEHWFNHSGFGAKVVINFEL